MKNNLKAYDIIIELWSGAPKPHCIHTLVRGVKVTHIPSGMSATCETERSPHANRVIAMQELNEKLERYLSVSPNDFNGISAPFDELKEQHAFMLALIKDLKSWDIDQWGHVRGLAVPAELRARMQEAIDKACDQGGDV